METELVKRYTFAVMQKLPENQRADIEKELNGLIEDMLEDRLQGREAARKDVETVLLELGDPAVLADKYRGYKRFLIGPDIFPIYMSILKIVFFAVGVAMLVVFAIQSILTPTQILDHLVQMIISSLMAIVQAFAWVTGTFAVLEWTGVKKMTIQKEMANEWSPADLPEIPDEKITISPAEPIFSIIFIVLFLVLVIFSIDLLGLWIVQKDAPMLVIPFFNEAVFRSFLPFIGGLMALSIVHEILRLVTRKQTLSLLAFEGLIKVSNFVLALFMFTGPAIWNADFMQKMVTSGLLAAGSEAYTTINEIWTRSTAGLIYLIGFITVIEMISLVIKALKLKNPTWRLLAAKIERG